MVKTIRAHSYAEMENRVRRIAANVSTLYCTPWVSSPRSSNTVLSTVAPIDPIVTRRNEEIARDFTLMEYPWRWWVGRLFVRGERHQMRSVIAFSRVRLCRAILLYMQVSGGGGRRR